MIRIIVGLFTGAILTGALFMGPLSLMPTTGNSDSSTLTETLPGIAEIYSEALTSSLQKAGDEIQDNDTALFYQKLLRAYELDEPSTGTAQAERSSLTEALPDIKKINQTAISLPLQEAGKNIQDEEIAQFYYKLLEDAGWTIEPD